VKRVLTWVYFMTRVLSSKKIVKRGGEKCCCMTINRCEEKNTNNFEDQTSKKIHI
jgi:hypothetical protein